MSLGLTALEILLLEQPEIILDRTVKSVRFISLYYHSSSPFLLKHLPPYPMQTLSLASPSLGRQLSSS